MSAFGGIGFCCCEPCVCSFQDTFAGSGTPSDATYNFDANVSFSPPNFFMSAGRLYLERGEDLSPNTTGSMTVTTARPSLDGLRMGVSAMTFGFTDGYTCFFDQRYLNFGLILGTATDLTETPANAASFQRSLVGTAAARFELGAIDPTGTISYTDNFTDADNTAFDAYEMRMLIEDEGGGLGSYTIRGYVNGVERCSISGVTLDLAAAVELGVYGNCGGQWDNLCIAACNPAQPDACELCDQTDLPASWTINITLASGFYSDAALLGECSASDECNVEEQYSGAQILLPEGMSATGCSWVRCGDDRAACVGDGTCAGGGPTIRMFVEAVSMVDTLVLEFYSYHYDPVTGDVDRVLLARYEAPIADICGPADFTKVSDATGGNYFPAGLTATRIDTSQNCLYDPNTVGSPCCPDVRIPEVLSASAETSQEASDIHAAVDPFVSNGNGSWTSEVTISYGAGSAECVGFPDDVIGLLLRCNYELDGSGDPVPNGFELIASNGANVMVATDASITCSPLTLSFTLAGASENLNLCNAIPFDITVEIPS